MNEPTPSPIRPRNQELARMGVLRLDQNTNVLGPNPALAKLDLKATDLSLYPEPHSETLVRALADHHGLQPQEILVTRGSDEALELLTRTFAFPKGSLAYPVPSFERYPMLGPQFGVKHTPVPLRGLRDLDVDALVATKASLVLLANPNNPTGVRIPSGELERLVATHPGTVVVDEAYIEYAGTRHSLLNLVRRHPNLVVLRTFSKAYGLAGLRVGWLAAHADTVRRVREAKAPFNVGAVAQKAATLALAEQAWLDGCVETVRAERDRLVAALARRDCKAVPSEANFVLVRVPGDAGHLAAIMRDRGVAVRPYTEGPLAGHLRITVGGPGHTDATLTALDVALETP